MINIMKASAGSGKTYNLARTYISLLLKSTDRYAYRHVLAVTFTNKATAEMKNRILKELHVLGTDPENSPYLEDFVPSIFPDKDSLKRRAGDIMVDILHDYGAFSVSTIDKFFQMTLKAFSREIGQFSSYQVELDRNSLVHESVDRILDSLTEESTGLINWLHEGVKEQLSQGRRVNVERTLYEIAERLKSEEQREFSEKTKIKSDDAFAAERLDAVRDECSSVILSFEESVRNAAQAVIDIMNDAGVPLSETTRGFMSQIEGFAGVGPALRVWRPTDGFFNNASDQDKWFSKAKAKQFLPRVKGILDEPLKHFMALFGTPFNIYNTALLIKDQTFDLRLAADIYREFDLLLKEKNVLGLDDSNAILRGIIDGSDAPFVYEKLGVRFEDFLLDEFQDTSSIQWQNFYPLLKESESSGKDNLIVGDVKQSIYRWRGSDWNLLASELPKQFASSKVDTLDSNWRSCKEIVEFNNDFFSFAAEAVNVKDLYSDVRQVARSGDRQPGHVRVTFCDKKDELQKVYESICSAMESHAAYGDIAVLVRMNSEGGAVANFLREKGIPVVSDDSLNIKSSVTVRRLVSILSYVENPADTVNSYLASSLGVSSPEKSLSLVDMCESLLRSLEKRDPEIYARETLYIQSFMDFLQEWTSSNGNSLVRFLKHWDESSSPCLSSPEDADAVRIMTIHKSKGLEFPYVIFPFAESVGFYRGEWHWCRTEGAAHDLPSATSAMFPVRLTEKTEYTLFSDRLREEKMLQTVDNLNTFYVSLTRAEKSLHIIACTPPASHIKSGVAKDLSQLLYSFAVSGGLEPSSGNDGTEEFVRGLPYDYSAYVRKKGSGMFDFEASFTSIPLNDRLVLNADASDYFGEDGTAGAGASSRINGIVLHDILSHVKYPSELRRAVDAAVSDGRLCMEEGEEDYALLESRLESVKELGWFPEKTDETVKVYTEMSIIDSDGSEHRPDRVIITPDAVTVVDYKSGERMDSYKYQVKRYMRILKKMGYPNVKGYVWYLSDGFSVALT